MFKIIVNNGQTYEIVQDDGLLQLNGKPFPWDVQPLNPYTFHILKDARSYTAEVLQADYAAKTFVIKINGHTYHIQAQTSWTCCWKKWVWPMVAPAR
jgi:carbonic anhydrase